MRLRSARCKTTLTCSNAEMRVLILPPPPTKIPGISSDSGLSTSSADVGVYRVDLPTAFGHP